MTFSRGVSGPPPMTLKHEQARPMNGRRVAGGKITAVGHLSAYSGSFRPDSAAYSGVHCFSIPRQRAICTGMARRSQTPLVSPYARPAGDPLAGRRRAPLGFPAISLVSQGLCGADCRVQRGRVPAGCCFLVRHCPNLPLALPIQHPLAAAADPRCCPPVQLVGGGEGRGEEAARGGEGDR